MPVLAVTADSQGGASTEVDEDAASDKSARNGAASAVFYEMQDPDSRASKTGRSLAPPLPIELTWKALELSVRTRDVEKLKEGSKGKTRHILHPCSGRFQFGEAAAIMGPSGAGVTYAGLCTCALHNWLEA